MVPTLASEMLEGEMLFLDSIEETDGTEIERRRVREAISWLIDFHITGTLPPIK